MAYWKFLFSLFSCAGLWAVLTLASYSAQLLPFSLAPLGLQNIILLLCGSLISSHLPTCIYKLMKALVEQKDCPLIGFTLSDSSCKSHIFFLLFPLLHNPKPSGLSEADSVLTVVEGVKHHQSGFAHRFDLSLDPIH